MRQIVFALMILSLTATAQKKGCGISAAAIIGRHQILFTAPPQQIPSAVSVDAPLLGNGRMAAAISGNPDRQVYHLARNDFWRLKSSYDESFPAMVGKLIIEMPGLEKGAYQIQQDIYTATTTSTFGGEDKRITIRSFVAATSDLLVLTLLNEGRSSVPVSVSLVLPDQSDFEDSSVNNRFPENNSTGKNKTVLWITRSFEKEVDRITKAACAVKVLGLAAGNRLQPGQKMNIVCALSGNFKSEDCLAAVVKEANQCNTDSLNALFKAHKNWWQNYWQKSWVQLADKTIERHYYISQYTMASCSRDSLFPPALFGSWITRERPAWNADYHLNYNHMAPYYALYASNHLEQATPYLAPLLAFMDRGKYYAGKITKIPEGILLPVGIGPLGIETTRKTATMLRKNPDFISGGNTEDEGLFWKQKSNAAYAVVNMAMQFYHTYDTEYTKKVYPFVKAVAVFWENYLQQENGSYVIYNDAIHEGMTGINNPILGLGLVRMVFKTAIDMSTELKVDEEKQIKWKTMRTQLVDFPTQEREGLQVFRYSTKGVDWVGDNTLGIQHIYPAGQIDLDSDPELLTVARNTIQVMNRWLDMNGSNSFFPAAVRIGYNPDTILHQLRRYTAHTYPNGYQLNNPHGIENCSTVPIPSTK